MDFILLRSVLDKYIAVNPNNICSIEMEFFPPETMCVNTIDGKSFVIYNKDIKRAGFDGREIKEIDIY